MNAFIKSQFSYCPFVWMFHSRTLNNKINKLREKALRLVYRNKTSLSFENLLKKGETVNIHQRNIQMLAIGMHKVKNDLALDIRKDIFHFVEEAEKQFNSKKKM